MKNGPKLGKIRQFRNSVNRSTITEYCTETEPQLTNFIPGHDFLVNDLSINEPIVQIQRVHDGLKSEKKCNLDKPQAKAEINISRKNSELSEKYFFSFQKSRFF